MRRALTGRPAYPLLVQLQALLLQQWYRLSGRDLEEAFRPAELPALLWPEAGGRGAGCDDLVALSDRSCRGESGGSGVRRAERAVGTVRPGDKAGTMIDATLVEADVKRAPMREDEVSERDPTAGFSRRGQRSFFGYRAHLAVDQGADLIRKAILTTADIGESIAADALLARSPREFGSAACRQLMVTNR